MEDAVAPTEGGAEAAGVEDVGTAEGEPLLGSVQLKQIQYTCKNRSINQAQNEAPCSRHAHQLLLLAIVGLKIGRHGERQ
uniref:Uncharacterized protein n=1 Tax=Oryza meridionalis TaxID=40149 RepID=A0A0E0DF51_9ORYZ